jgi:hypothetical protein
MNEQQLAAVKQALELMHNRGDVGVDEWIAAEAALQSIIAQHALDKMAEDARAIGLRLDDWDKIGCVNHDCDKCKAVQEPVGEVLVKVARFLGVVRVYAQDIQPKHELETDKPLHWKARELQDEVIRLIDTTPPAAQPAVQEGRDWSLLEATQESLREHMAEIKRLKAAQPAPVKTYSGGKPWPVAPAPDPAPIIQQMVTALEGSGTRMRSDQWYIEIEAVAAGKFYLNSKGEGL